LYPASTCAKKNQDSRRPDFEQLKVEHMLGLFVMVGFGFVGAVVIRLTRLGSRKVFQTARNESDFLDKIGKEIDKVGENVSNMLDTEDEILKTEEKVLDRSMHESIMLAKIQKLVEETTGALHSKIESETHASVSFFTQGEVTPLGQASKNGEYSNGKDSEGQYHGYTRECHI
jgi:hypothetical protein